MGLPTVCSSCVTWMLVSVAVVAVHSFPQQPVALPPHLLRQYLAQQQQQRQQEATPIYEEQQSAQQVYVQSQQARPAAFRASPPLQQAQQQQYVPQYTQAQYVAQPQPQPQQQVYTRPKVQQQQQINRPRPQLLRPEDELPEDYDPSPSYQFGFDVNDDQYTNYQNRKEERQGDVIKGSYSVVDSDGFIRTVTYTADPKEGFKAEVVRKPTDIVVKVPTPQPPQESHSPLRHQQTAQYLEAASPAAAARPQHQPQQYYRYQQQ